MVTTLFNSSVAQSPWCGAAFARENLREKQQSAAKCALLYKRARYYDTETGEFISRDPLEYVDGMSLYRGYFVPGAVDPTGEGVWQLIRRGGRWVLERVSPGRGPRRPRNVPDNINGPHRNSDGTIVTPEEQARRQREFERQLQRELGRRRNGGGASPMLPILLDQAVDLGIDLTPVIGDLRDLPELLEEIDGLAEQLEDIGDQSAEINSQERELRCRRVLNDSGPDETLTGGTLSPGLPPWWPF